MASSDNASILLVDDQPENLLALEAILDTLGERLVRAYSGAETLELLSREAFAVIVLGLNMPGLEAIETAARIREHEEDAHTPILFVTAVHLSDADVTRGYALGAVDYLLKPFPPEVLRSKVAACVQLFKEIQTLKQRLAAITQPAEPVNVLVVNDNPMSLFTIGEVLNGLGVQVHKAGSGAEALRALLAHDFAMVLMDVRMPDMSGFEVVELMRQSERLRQTPVVFITAMAKSVEDVSRGYALGAVDYVFSPFPPDVLRLKVNALLSLFKQKLMLERQVAEIARLNGELAHLAAAVQQLLGAAAHHQVADAAPVSAAR